MKMLEHWGNHTSIEVNRTPQLSYVTVHYKIVYYCVVATVYLPYINHCILWESTILQWTKSRKAAFGFLRSYMHDLADLSHNANRMTSLKLFNSEQIVIQCRFDLIGNFSLLIHDLKSFYYLLFNFKEIEHYVS